MRLPALILLALPALLPTGASAQAALNKCIDAQGKVTYSNLPCRGAREIKRVEIDPPPPREPVRSVPQPVPPLQPPQPQVQPTPQPAPTPVRPAMPQALPAPMQPQPAPPAVPATPAPKPRPSPAAVTPPRAQPAAHASASQCDTLTDTLGRVFDKMDQARRKGYTQEQMDTWNQEVKDLERRKQQSGCF